MSYKTEIKNPDVVRDACPQHPAGNSEAHQIWLQSTETPSGRETRNALPILTPIRAPTMQCELELGIPNHHVAIFQKHADANKATSVVTRRAVGGR